MSKTLRIVLCSMLTIAIALLGACGGGSSAPKKYSVTFLDGDEVVATVTVSQGAALSEDDIPEAPVGHATEFLGWFVGTEQVQAGYTPTASVSARARFASPTDEIYTVSAPYSDEYRITGLKTGYVEGEKVQFYVEVLNTAKQLQSVTSPDVEVQPRTPEGYGFTMPAHDVNLEITLTGKADDSRIDLFMQGPLYQGRMRSIYAKLDGISGNFSWSSSNPQVVGISSDYIVQGDMPEAFLIAKGVGDALITCVWNEDDSVSASYLVTVKDKEEGVSIPADVYSKLEGSLKLTSEESLLDFDAAYASTVSQKNDIVTVFEETADETADNEFAEANLTDAFQITVSGGSRVTFARTYVSNGRQVCEEYIDFNNEVHLKTVLNDEGDTIRWTSSFYNNIFHGRTSYSNPDMWKSFDGSQTYHYTGGDTSATAICAFLYQADISPDDMYITVSGEDISLTVEIDPANYQAGKKYGRRIETVFSDFGTAEIQHLTPYETLDYHAGITEARETMAALRNYKATVTFEGMSYEFTYLEDTIDVVVKSGQNITNHYGSHADGEGYYNYTYDDATASLVKTDEFTTPWNDVNRYPDFAFASEIFEDSPVQQNTYYSRSSTGAFVKHTSYLPDFLGYYSFNSDGSLQIEDSHIISVSTSISENDGSSKSDLTILFSDFGTASVGIDFSSAITPDDPTDWATGAPALAAELQKCGVDLSAIPYLQPSVGFKDSVNPNTLGGSNVVPGIFIETEAFDNNDDRDAYIAAYKALLVEQGWTQLDETAQGTEDAITATLYEKGDYRIAVVVKGYYGAALRQVKLYIYGPSVQHPED